MSHRRKSYRLGLFLVTFLSCVVFLFIACGDEDPFSEGGGGSGKASCLNCVTGVERFDGTYDVNFIVTQTFLNAEIGDVPPLTVPITVEGGAGVIDIQDVYQGQPAFVKGTFSIDEAGNIISDVSGQALGIPGKVELVEGFASVGILTGSFVFVTNGQEVAQGELTGFLQGEFPVVGDEFVVTDYDGIYAAQLIRTFEDENGQPFQVIDLQFCLDVRQGQIEQSLNPEVFRAAGGVQSSGAFSLQGGLLVEASSQMQVLIDGQINPDGTLVGLFQIESNGGDVAGQRVDQCPFQDILPDTSTDTTGGAANLDDPSQGSILCDVDVDFSGDGIGGFFSGIASTVFGSNRAYCRNGARCKFMDEKIESFGNMQSCLTECERLAVEDDDYDQCNGDADAEPEPEEAQ